jgi:hypothetical protein
VLVRRHLMCMQANTRCVCCQPLEAQLHNLQSANVYNMHNTYRTWDHHQTVAATWGFHSPEPTDAQRLSHGG